MPLFLISLSYTATFSGQLEIHVSLGISARTYKQFIGDELTSDTLLSPLSFSCLLTASPNE